jgi:hypothetical protein
MALIARAANDPVASFYLAVRSAAIAVGGIAVVALLMTRQDTIATDYAMTLPIAYVAIPLLPVVAFFAQRRLHDAIPTVLLVALGRAPVAVNRIAVVALFIAFPNPIPADLALALRITPVAALGVPVVAFFAQPGLQVGIPAELALALGRAPIAAGRIAIVALFTPVASAIATHRHRTALVLPYLYRHVAIIQPSVSQLATSIATPTPERPVQSETAGVVRTRSDAGPAILPNLHWCCTV